MRCAVCGGTTIPGGVWLPHLNAVYCAKCMENESESVEASIIALERSAEDARLKAATPQSEYIQ